MKKILLGIAGVLGVAIVVILIIAATKPDTFHVERKTTSSAAPSAVYANVEDFHRWAQWSPWEKLDPGMSKTFSGSAHGPGAVYEWKGNKDVGEGRMTITESRDNERVQIRLQFLEPFPADNRTTFTLAPAGGGTEITWAMDGANTFMGKVMSVFVDMDSLVGGDFERGLVNLKQVSEGAHASQ